MGRFLGLIFPTEILQGPLTEQGIQHQVHGTENSEGYSLFGRGERDRKLIDRSEFGEFGPEPLITSEMFPSRRPKFRILPS